MNTKMIIAAILSCLFITSCNNGIDDSKEFVSGYFTITGNKDLGYTAYADGGGVATLAAGTNLQDAERAQLSLQYNKSDKQETNGQISVKNAQVISGEFVTVIKPITLNDAKEKGILEPDKRAKVLKLLDLWAWGGYLNIGTSCYYKQENDQSISPDFYLIYNLEYQTPNKLDLTFVYDTKGNNEGGGMRTGNLLRSYDISKLGSLVPGNDSIEVKITFDGISEPVISKLARKTFTKPFTPPLS